MRWNRWKAAAVAAACALLAAACGRPPSEANSSPAGVSPVKGLAEVTPAGAKPVASVVWATNRDVISLDPAWTAT